MAVSHSGFLDDLGDRPAGAGVVRAHYLEPRELAILPSRRLKIAPGKLGSLSHLRRPTACGGVMLTIILGSMLIALGSILLVLGIRDESNTDGYVKKADVISAFKETDWSTQRFFNGETPILDVKHRDSFYASVEIDQAIERLNKVLNP